jgi:glyoxylase-like metal-dependent hydrolase (beta-lactamase superfamily II)
MTDPMIYTIDLNFLGRRGTIGAYLIPHANGCILIETGPGSTIPNLVSGLRKNGFEVSNVTDAFLTHIHLDHAGAAGWLAQHGAHIHVHENGAPHLINPEKLLASAQRIYGDRMDSLWGDFLPIPEEHLSIMYDDEVINISELCIRSLDVPGHANHQLAYLIGDACFSGDIGGIRLRPQQYISLPMPPPEFHLEKWRESIHRLQQKQPTRIIPTHFGVYSDAKWQLQAVLDALDEVEAWMESSLAVHPTLEELRQQFIEFEQNRAIQHGLDKATADAQQIANPSFMSADGILRYWNKFRNQS